MRLLTLVLLFFCTILTAQDRPLTYFSQVSYGRPVYGGLGRNIIAAGDINKDSIADIAIYAHSTFQIGYGRLENDELYFDMQAVDFLEYGFFYWGQIVDVDSDGDNDFTMKRNTTTSPPILYSNYVFPNLADTIQISPSSPPTIFPEEVLLKFGPFNEDEITDAYYRMGNEQIIMDGATGETYQPFSPTLSTLTTSNANYTDFNNDGMMDFLLHLDNFPSSDTIMHEVYINEGDFVFTTYSTRIFLRANDYGDFDGDGILDIVGELENGDNIKYGIKTNLVSADAAEYFEVNIVGQAYDPDLLPYDLNEDGYDDLIVFTNDTIYYCQNNQDQTFEIFHYPQINPSLIHFTSHPSWPHGTVVSQHGNAVPLLYHLNFDGTQFTVTKSSATISPPVLQEPPYYHRTARLDTDMDGLFELAVGNEFELSTAEIQNHAFQEYTAHQFEGAVLPFFSSLLSADFNQDSILDLVYALPNDPNVLQITFGQSDSTFSTPTTLATNFNLCFRIQAGDFDGNGFLDFAASGGLGDNARFSIFLNQDGTQFIEQQMLDTRHEAWNIIDPNKDGIADLAITGINYTRIFINDGLGGLDSTQLISGRVVKNNETDTPLLFMTTGDLIEIDSAGTGKTVLGNVNIRILSRTSYVLDYNLDGLPDLLASDPGLLSDPFDTTYLVLTDTVGAWEVQAFPNRYVQSVLDMDGDGTEDILWQLGSQLWVELMKTPVWSAIVEPSIKPLRISPNPATDILYFGDSEWLSNRDSYSVEIYNTMGQLVFAKRQKGNRIELSGLAQGAYFLRLNNAIGEVFGGSFIRL